MNDLDFKTVAAAALAEIDSLLAEWLPNGKYDGHEYVALNPNRADKRLGSFRINLNNGLWSDFACDAKGKDLIDLYAYLFCGGKKGQALRDVAERLRIGNFAPVQRERFVAEKTGKKERDSWLPIVPFDEDKLNHLEGSKSFQWARNGRKLGFRAVYRDASGAPLCVVQRFIDDAGGKSDLPFTWCKGKKSEESRWISRRVPDPQPLFGLDALAAAPDAPVLIVEGEKCKLAAADFFAARFVVISWLGGCNGWKKADWSPLAGRDVIIWADCDSKRVPLTVAEKKAGMLETDKPFLAWQHQGGMKAALGIGEKLHEMGCVVRFVDIPREPDVLPDGYDVADAIADNGAGMNAYDVVADENLLTYDSLIQEVSVAANPFPAPFPEKVAPNFQGVQGGEMQPENHENSAMLGGAVEIDAEKQGYYEWALKNLCKIDGKESFFCIPMCAIWGKREILAKLGRETYEHWFNDPRLPIIAKPKVDLLIERKRAEIIAQDPLYQADCNRYILIYGTTDVCDVQKMGYRGENGVMSTAALKAFMGKQRYEIWESSPNRLQVMKPDFGFFPFETFGISRDENGVAITEDGFVKLINTYNGLPFECSPDFDFESIRRKNLSFDELIFTFERCATIILSIKMLCNDDMKAMTWILNWIAHRVRFPTIKQDTALVVASPVQGAGKSLIFSRLMLRIFGQYGGVLGQADMESNFTAPYRDKMYICYEEVSSQRSRFDLAGQIKDQISGEKIRIEGKGKDAEFVQNFIGFVYLSNYRSPVVVERDDRRFMVIAPETKMPKDMAEMLAAEIDSDECVQEFVDLLYSLPLTYVDEQGKTVPFTAHTHPYDTPAKEAMKDWSAFPHEIFVKEWFGGELGLPVICCAAQTLFEVFNVWATRNKERHMTAGRFRANLDNLLGIKVYRTNVGGDKMYIVVPPENMMSGKVLRELVSVEHGLDRYYASHVSAFKSAANSYFYK
ncbi:DUF5906 domain-containing protein [Wielerella bovis]|uniref:DUF5906 domain-containing protein n=1 Tax=Wielerella bovis TaxID=2917790 RepID=UPI0020193272|nr:DUF5906 domain-containing protein [Wielerella bovis]ULJ67891.1 DUF5906 domain-containing protein [Wielerella bovis]